VRYDDPVRVDDHAVHNRRRRRIAILIACLVPGAFDAMHAQSIGARIEPWYLAYTTLGVLGLLVALTATFDLGVRRRMTNARCFALSAVVAIGLGVAQGLAGWALSGAFDLPIVLPAHRAAAIVARMGAVSGLLGLGLWAIAVVLPFAVGDAYRREREADQLRAAAELARLRANLQPHFLFNTLSTVAGLIGEDPREARRLIGALGDLLRDSLVDGDDMRTLDEEVAWLRHYAGILETRHRGFLTFRWDIAEPTRRLRIPRLLLQPLVENAVRHGALRRTEGGEVAVRTELAPDARRMTCVIEDNGPGPATRAARPGALGLGLVTRRLALSYAGDASFRLERVDGRTRSVVELPADGAP
jgi:hypothetical protein